MPCRLYLITPPVFDPAVFGRQVLSALSGGDVACLQLRLKGATDDAILAAAATLMPLCLAENVAFLINDRPDLALQAGADGVHIGQEDGDYAAARRLLGPDGIIGVTCHNSKHLAMEAAEAGADYVAFGAVYPTPTKPAATAVELDLLQWWTEMFEVPCVAIGGITVENCAPVIATGADFLAVSNGVWQYPKGPDAAVLAFNKAMA